MARVGLQRQGGGGFNMCQVRQITQKIVIYSDGRAETVLEKCLGPQR